MINQSVLAQNRQIPDNRGEPPMSIRNHLRGLKILRGTRSSNQNIDRKQTSGMAISFAHALWEFDSTYF